jgi:hypothetical protein
MHLTDIACPLFPPATGYADSAAANAAASALGSASKSGALLGALQYEGFDWVRSATASNITVLQDAGRTVPARVNTVPAAPPVSGEIWAKGQESSSSGNGTKNGAGGRRQAAGNMLWVLALCLLLMLHW